MGRYISEQIVVAQCRAIHFAVGRDNPQILQRRSVGQKGCDWMHNNGRTPKMQHREKFGHWILTEWRAIPAVNRRCQLGRWVVFLFLLGDGVVVYFSIFERMGMR